jgi:hypothetical protein
MTKNKTIYVALRMNELEVSKLDYIRQPGETRSAAIRRLIDDDWFYRMRKWDAENQFNVTDYLPPNI